MENTQKTSTSAKRFSATRVSALLLVFFMIVGFMAYEEQIWFLIAERKAENNDFNSAYTVACRAESSHLDVLKEYINLRLEINNAYPKLLNSFDISIFESWRSRASSIAACSGYFSKRVSESALRLNESLNLLCNLYYDYCSLGGDIDELMDVFSELNRLYSTDENGENIVFTVDEENEKIENWIVLNDTINSIALNIPNYENLYLLNYFIKESRGECDDLSTAMRKVTENGYSSSDKVRLSGTAQKSFPDIQSSSNYSVNVLRKDEYIEAMYSCVCRGLVQSLGEYYTVGLNER